MRINIQFNDRVGIAHEILAVFAKRGLNVVAVEVDPPHIYIDSPELVDAMLPELQKDCRLVSGVGEISQIDILPGDRRRLNLDTIMSAMEDPVLAVDAMGKIIVANAAAASVAGLSEEAICQKSLADLLDDQSVEEELLSQAFYVSSREVMFHGEPL